MSVWGIFIGRTLVFIYTVCCAWCGIPGCIHTNIENRHETAELDQAEQRVYVAPTCGKIRTNYYRTAVQYVQYVHIIGKCTHAGSATD